MASKLMVNKSKFKFWFNSNTPKFKRKEFAKQLGIKVVEKFGKYLGTYIIELIKESILGENY